jgi:hypothetical protein
MLSRLPIPHTAVRIMGSGIVCEALDKNSVLWIVETWFSQFYVDRHGLEEMVRQDYLQQRIFSWLYTARWCRPTIFSTPPPACNLPGATRRTPPALAEETYEQVKLSWVAPEQERKCLNRSDRAFWLPDTNEPVLWTTHVALGHELVQFISRDIRAHKNWYCMGVVSTVRVRWGKVWRPCKMFKRWKWWTNGTEYRYSHGLHPPHLLLPAGETIPSSRVNGTSGHWTCLICALKLHILQNKLTGHTTYKTCAPEVTKRFDIWFLAKTGGVHLSYLC